MKAAIFGMCLVLAACGGGEVDNQEVAGIDAFKVGRVEGSGRCGIANAFRTSAVAGVQLAPNATLARKTVVRLERWMRTKAKPIIGNRGGGLVAVSVPSHYACRTRNSRPGARLSEHAKGNAIDISAFILADGTRITVLDGWNGSDRRLLQQLHASACGIFGTVLGPNSDRHHQDHFHFDVADYRSGAYCR